MVDPPSLGASMSSPSQVNPSHLDLCSTVQYIICTWRLDVALRMQPTYAVLARLVCVIELDLNLGASTTAPAASLRCRYSMTV